MVKSWGMSEKLGPLKYGEDSEHLFLDNEISSSNKNYSEKTAEKIDDEIKDFVIKAYELAKNILKEKESALHLLAKELLEKETLDGKDLDRIIEAAKNPLALS